MISILLVFLAQIVTVAASITPSIYPFTIELDFVGGNESVSMEIQAIFQAAATRWCEIIAEGYSTYAIINPGEYCGGFVIAEETVVENLLIQIEIISLDGKNGVLAAAGPCLVDALMRPRFGVMRFDSADVQSLLASGSFENVVKHEMGHVLGLGSFWDLFFLVGNTVLPGTGGFAYLGEFGNIGNGQVLGSGDAVVEDLGGEGTARVHWKEAVYDNEIMTGFVEAGNTSMPISLLTVGALRDLGYVVNESAADAYTVPSRRRSLRTSPKPRFTGCQGSAFEIQHIASHPKHTRAPTMP